MTRHVACGVRELYRDGRRIPNWWELRNHYHPLGQHSPVIGRLYADPRSHNARIDIYNAAGELVGHAHRDIMGAAQMAGDLL